MSLAPALPGPRRSVDKRLVLAGILLALVAVAFWTGSRYPALDNKALMGGDADIEGLAFDRVVVVEPDASVPLRIGANAVNWAYTNKQGMTFGVLFAGLILTVLPLLTRRQFQGRMANTLLGVAMGAPLGVCVNCAVPIAESLHHGGARGETTVAALLSSPTLNVVVLSMTFALFPLWLAGLKLGLTLAFIVLAVPLIVRFLWGKTAASEEALAADLAPVGPTLGPELPTAPAYADAVGFDVAPSGWGAAAVWTAKALGRNLWYIVKTTVPLMLLAGALGAVAVTLLPWDLFAEALPDLDTRRATLRTLAALGAVAVLGTFLPVPIAFDVIICAILTAAGVPLPYVAVLFVTLGLFSAYPLLQIWRTMSRPAAVGLFLGVATLGVGAGWTAALVEPRIEARETAALLSVLQAETGAMEARPAFPTEALSAAQVAALLRPVAPALPMSGAVSRAPLGGAGGGEPSMAFERLAGAMLGLDEPANTSAARMIVGVWTNRGVASGDVHGDGWPDLAFTSEAGVSLYANVGGERFVRQEVAVAAFDTLDAASVALVDLDGDAALDLFVGTIGGGNHVVYNDGGAFTDAGHVALPNLPGAYRTTAVAFGDVDRDGDLDVALGNVLAFNANAPGRPARSSLEGARNALLINDGGRDAFALRPLPGVPGETLSLLLSDVDGDDDLDLFVGNDFVAPDILYLGDGDGGFEPVTRQDGIVPVSTLTTMSIASADLDNDLAPEILLGQISQTQVNSPRRTPAEACAGRPDAGRAACERDLATQTLIFDAMRRHEPSRCLALDDPAEREGCVANTLTTSRRQGTAGAPGCVALARSGRWPLQRRLCDRYAEPPPVISDEAFAAYLPFKTGDRNVLLTRDGDGFADASERLGLERTGWTWNARFADFDLDGWQDLFAVNGTTMDRRTDRNLLFRNLAGERFEEVGETVGAISWMDTNAWTGVDFDRDGDLDLVVPTSLGPVDVLRNETRGRAVGIELRDGTGRNPYAVGAVVTVTLSDGTRQMRELQASGGFISFDEPVLHFGLGDADAVTEIEVRWPTGERTTHAGPFPAGSRYTVRR